MKYNVGDRIKTKFGSGVVQRVVDGQGYAVMIDGYTTTMAIYYHDIIEEKAMTEVEINEIVMIQPRSVKADPYTLSLLKLKTQADYDKFLETHEYVSERTLDSGYIMKTYQEKM